MWQLQNYYFASVFPTTPSGSQGKWKRLCFNGDGIEMWAG